MNGLWFDGHILTLSNGGTPARILEADRDLNGRVVIWERGASRYNRMFRDTIPKDKTYQVEVLLVADTWPEFTQMRDDWEQWHDWQRGTRTLTRLTDSGYWYVAEAVAAQPVWANPRGPSCVVTQAYELETMMWRGRDEKSASGAFAGAGSVNVACANNGNYPAWIRMDCTGVVNVPKWTIGSNYLEFSLDNDNATDLLEIVCTPPATAYLTPHDAGETGVYGYNTEGSTFSGMQLPANATTNVVLSATSGTATSVIYWYEWYNSLR